MTTPATPAPMTAEAVEAAAKVHHRLHCNGRLPDGSQPCDREPREQDKATARQMLEAAAPVLAAAERERCAQLRRLLTEAMHLHQHGERAPGGDETWGAWYAKAEMLLRQGGGT